MKLKQICILVFILLFVINRQVVCAQNNTIYLQQADSLLEAKNYKAAYKIYDRLWFFANDIEKHNMANNYFSASFQSQQFNTSLNTLQFLKNGAEPRLGSGQKIWELAAHFNLNNYEICLQEIEKYKSDTGANFLANLYYFKILCELQLNRKENVVETANMLKPFACAAKQKTLDSLVQYYVKTENFSPKKAQILSLILPGLGQLYQKDYGNAANAFLLNGSLWGAAIITAHFYQWPQAALFWVFYVPHYYLGNGKSARDLALQKNELTQENIYQSFKNWDPN